MGKKAESERGVKAELSFRQNETCYSAGSGVKVRFRFFAPVLER